MKEILFDKSDADFLIQCLQEQKASYSMGLYPQDQEFLKKIDAEKNQCDKLIKKIQNAEKKIKVSSAKGKGRNLQYWVCEQICNLFRIKFNQQDDDCPVHSREMGLNGTDIILRGEIGNKFPYAIECKCCESLSIPEWVRQARRNAKDKKWLLVFKKQTIGGEPLVLMDWNTFIDAYKR